ncbi:cell division protein ZapE [Rhizobium leguminosarum]|uniref:hypothetical protein n=1 Tax=Rhizobium leguminosarum TaxID=384 RepID=UPI001C916A5B|nr:hypothetical protein [Rhizobium leguminosarum]MBY2941880.1 cell division protein ZapE [Rhizobium leguminosarum]
MSDETIMRWDPYSLTRDDEFDTFWKAHVTERPRKLLLILGRGFDVRALATASRLKSAGAVLQIWLLAFDNGLADSPLRAKLTLDNYNGLVALFGEAAIKRIGIKIGGPAGSAATSRNTQAAIKGAGSCSGFDDVVIDISAMPRMVALTAVAQILYNLDQMAKTGGPNVNLHVTTAESVAADLGAQGGSLSDAVTLVAGFSGQLTAQGTENWPRVWFPVLGERQHERLDLIRTEVDPDEICPVIPFPTRNARRGDEIVNEHRAILFDEFQIEPKNVLLACEYNPFEAYKQLFQAMDRYRRALNKLGGCKAFVSPVSSKLLSIGVLLACYDHKYGQISGPPLDVGIPYVETAVYGDPDQGTEPEFELYSMWIRGEWEV